jgi:hypothetical protein
MEVYVPRRQPAQVAAWLRDAGFAVEAQMLLGLGGSCRLETENFRIARPVTAQEIA